MSLLDLFLEVSEVVNKTAEQPSLVGYLKDRLTKTEEKAMPTADMTVRVSELIRMCPREYALRSLYRVPRIDKIAPGLQRTFDIGTAFHTLVQSQWLSDVLVGHWLCRGCGVRTDTPGADFQKRPKVCVCGSMVFEYIEPTAEDVIYGITGHIDGIVQMGDDARDRSVLELKTVNSFMCSKVVSTQSPFPAHIDQAQMYMSLLRLPFANILYFNKDTSDLHEFKIAVDLERVERLIGRLSEMRTAVRNGTVPETRVCDNDKCTRAKGCPVRVKCFGG